MVFVALVAAGVVTLWCAGAMFVAELFAPGSRRLPQPEAAKVVRTIRVRIACDEEWRKQPRWEELARRRLERASAVFEERFGIEWLAADLVPWESNDDTGSVEALSEELAQVVPPGRADVVVGFSGQLRARDSSVDYYINGWAPYFGRYAIVRAARERPGEDWYLGALVHELGHLLGAWHCTDDRSVMYGLGSRRTSEDFEAQSIAVMQLTRDFDFTRGVAWLDSDRRGRMDSIYRSGHVDAVALPYLFADLDEGWRLLRRDGDVEGARAAFRRALSGQEARVGPSDPSLVMCLQPLAWANLREPGRDVDEAERLARRCSEIAATTNVWVHPPSDCEALLGAVGWERGRGAESVETLRKAYEARVAAIGERDPHSVELAELIRRCGAQMHAVPATGSGK